MELRNFQIGNLYVDTAHFIRVLCQHSFDPHRLKKEIVKHIHKQSIEVAKLTNTTRVFIITYCHTQDKEKIIEAIKAIESEVSRVMEDRRIENLVVNPQELQE